MLRCADLAQRKTRPGDAARPEPLTSTSMLRAGLIGFPSSGKTALFQLLTSAREAPRHGGKRSERRRVARARRAARQADGALQPEEARAGDGGVRRHRRRGRRANRRAGAARRRARSGTPTRCCTSCGCSAIRPCRTRRDRSIRRATCGRWKTRSSSPTSASSSAGSNGSSATSRRARTPELREGAGDPASAAATALEDGQPLRALELAADDAKRLRGFQFLSAKPLLLVLNLDEGGPAARRRGRRSWRASSRSCPAPRRARCRSARRSSSRSRSSIPPMPPRSWPISGLRESGLDRVIRASYDLLGYISFFTVGEDEMPRLVDSARHAGACSPPARSTATSRAASSAPRSCGYEHLLARGSLAACRDHGELRLEGKEYIVQDGDVINFRHAT